MHPLTRSATTAALGLFFAATASAADGTYSVKLLTPEAALTAAQAAMAHCRRAGHQVAVAVVDRAGLVQVLLRDRFAGAHTLDVAPQKAWTLELLASTAGMSRTAFATRFRAAMRVPPGKYLGRLRLAIAQRAVESGQGLKQAARETGYGNVSALSRALSRTRANATGKRAALSA